MKRLEAGCNKTKGDKSKHCKNSEQPVFIHMLYLVSELVTITSKN